MKCSACGFTTRWKYDFCPQCGAYTKDRSQHHLQIPKLHWPQRKTTDKKASNAKPTSAASQPPKPNAAHDADKAQIGLPVVRKPEAPPAAPIPAPSNPNLTKPPANPSSQSTLRPPASSTSSSSASIPKLPTTHRATPASGSMPTVAPKRVAPPRPSTAPSSKQLPVVAPPAPKSSAQIPAVAGHQSSTAIAAPSSGLFHRLTDSPSTTKIMLRPVGKPVQIQHDPLWRYVGVLIFMMLWAAATLIGFGAVGAYQGWDERVKRELNEAVDYKEKAKEYIRAGNVELALAALNESYRRNPKDAEIKALLSSLEIKPPPAVAAPATIIEPALTVIPANQSEVLSSAFADGKKFFDDKQYEDALGVLESLRRVAADYRKNEVEQMLFTANVNLARQYETEERMEEAIQKFDSALKIRSDQSIALERYLLAEYVRGLSAWSADWRRAVEAFGEIVRINADFRDARSRLYVAHVAYGDYLMNRALSPCYAEVEYTAAVAMGPTAELQTKLAQAKSGCAANPVPVTGPPPAAVRGTPPPQATPEAVLPAPGAKYIVQVKPGYATTSDAEASIQGRVADRLDKPIGELQLVVFNKAGNYERIEKTSPDGYYAFDGLPPGEYGVRIANDPASKSAILSVGSKQRVFINFKLP